MNGDDSVDLQPSKETIVELGTASPPIVLHRLGAVCREKKIPRRVLAKRLGITLEDLRLEEESIDLSIGRLTQWAAALGVPVTELIIEPDIGFGLTCLEPPQAKRLMEAANSLRKRTRRRSVQRLAQTFMDQLSEMLPELEQIAQNGQRPVRRVRRTARPGPLRPLPDHILLRRREPDEL